MKMKELVTISILIMSCLSFQKIPITNCQGDEEVYILKQRTVYTNGGDQGWNLSVYDRIWNIFMNNSWQTVFLINASWPYTKSEDSDGNPIIILDTPTIQPNKNLTVVLNFKIIEKKRKAPDVRILESGNLSNIPYQLIEEFCTATGTWLTENESLRELAYEVWKSTGNTSNVLEIVTEIANWMGNNINPPIADHEIPYYPNETLSMGRGDCDDQANLLITLCRILEIPAYLQVGCLHYPVVTENKTYWDDHVTVLLKNIAFHAWAMVFIPPWGWLPFDMTLGYVPLNPLAGITSAPVWETGTAQLVNVTNSDWAGEGRKERERTEESPLYIYEEDELIRQTQENAIHRLINQWFPWIMFSTTVIIVAIFMGYYHLAKRKRTRWEEDLRPNSPSQRI